MKRRSWIALPLLLCVLLGGFLWRQLERPRDEFVRSTLIGQPLPAFTLPPATEGVKGLANTDFADGKPRLLNIFASWCIPCKAEAPVLDALKGRGVEIYAVAIQDKPENVAAFLAEHGNPFARIGATDMGFQVKLGSTGVPETYVIAGNGRITYQHIGEIRPEHVPMLLQKLEAAK